MSLPELVDNGARPFKNMCGACGEDVKKLKKLCVSCNTYVCGECTSSTECHVCQTPWPTTCSICEVSNDSVVKLTMRTVGHGQHWRRVPAEEERLGHGFRRVNELPTRADGCGDIVMYGGHTYMPLPMMQHDVCAAVAHLNTEDRLSEDCAVCQLFQRETKGLVVKCTDHRTMGEVWLHPSCAVTYGYFIRDGRIRAANYSAVSRKGHAPVITWNQLMEWRLGVNRSEARTRLVSSLVSKRASEGGVSWCVRKCTPSLVDVFSVGGDTCEVGSFFAQGRRKRFTVSTQSLFPFDTHFLHETTTESSSQATKEALDVLFARRDAELARKLASPELRTTLPSIGSPIPDASTQSPPLPAQSYTGHMPPPPPPEGARDEASAAVEAKAGKRRRTTNASLPDGRTTKRLLDPPSGHPSGSRAPIRRKESTEEDHRTDPSATPSHVSEEAEEPATQPSWQEPTSSLQADENVRRDSDPPMDDGQTGTDELESQWDKMIRLSDAEHERLHREWVNTL